MSETIEYKANEFKVKLPDPEPDTVYYPILISNFNIITNKNKNNIQAPINWVEDE